MWEVRYLPDAQAELEGVPPREQAAIENAIKKLAQLGGQLPYPHSSNVQGATNLRELRPRGGNSPWRAFYRRVSDIYVIAAIGPEAQNNSRDFNRAVAAAQDRLDDLEED
ncbi:type II toxin-antitoxin system RelE/ParE family toxin [Actinomycetospora soli]|uniref:type II toxin-antitoxin system RelE/ParE family toxin n=1 Tax=Actinomycetospora soli TaxID=2893887 RepID=UPI001E601971|nr:type II toxin-antitoxin system RelE/ParE family toxin [Actinomycetospora soli]MCD2191363.1 type II toxin-antitoxin system RelE/ParE family toxin [Actinomycetospora soli]